MPRPEQCPDDSADLSRRAPRRGDADGNPATDSARSWSSPATIRRSIAAAAGDCCATARSHYLQGTDCASRLSNVVRLATDDIRQPADHRPQSGLRERDDRRRTQHARPVDGHGNGEAARRPDDRRTADHRPNALFDPTVLISTGRDAVRRLSLRERTSFRGAKGDKPARHPIYRIVEHPLFRHIPAGRCCCRCRSISCVSCWMARSASTSGGSMVSPLGN